MAHIDPKSEKFNREYRKLEKYIRMADDKTDKEFSREMQKFSHYQIHEGS